MTMLTVQGFVGRIARHFGNSRNRTTRHLQQEIARYPESVRADIGWPPRAEHPSDRQSKDSGGLDATRPSDR